MERIWRNMRVIGGPLTGEWVDYRGARNEIDKLQKALRLADEGIQRGQACRTEAEFTRWMREVQSMRPNSNLFSVEEEK